MGASEVGREDLASGRPPDHEVQRFVRELIADFLEMAPDEIEVEADLFERYAVESLQLVELMGAMEARFGARLEFDDFKDHRTVDSVAACARSRLADQA